MVCTGLCVVVIKKFNNRIAVSPDLTRLGLFFDVLKVRIRVRSIGGVTSFGMRVIVGSTPTTLTWNKKLSSKLICCIFAL